MPAHSTQIPNPVEYRGSRKQSMSTKFFLGPDTEYRNPEYTKKVQISETQPEKRRGSMFMRRRSSLTALLATPPPGMKWMSLEVWKCIKWLVAWTLYCIMGALVFITLEVQEKKVEVPHRYWQQFKELMTKQQEKETLIYLRKNLIKMCDHTFLNQSFSFELSDVDGLPVWRNWDTNPNENMTDINNEEETLFADLKDVETACRESLFVVQRITSFDTAPSLIDAMYYTMTAVTTIGYGHICPTTTANKIFCVLYCLIGVPLTCIFLNNFAESLSIKMLHTYKRAVCYRCQYPGLDDIPGSSSECTHEDDKRCHTDKKVTLLYMITAFFLGIGFIVFMFIPSIAIMFIEDWTYLDSFYFTFITLSTIGFGDFVAGYGENHESGLGTVYKLVLIIWIIIALGYWVLVLKFVTKALKKTTRKITKSFSTRVVTDQKTFFRQLVSKNSIMQVKHHNEDKNRRDGGMNLTDSQHNMVELMNEVEGALIGKDKDGKPLRARSITMSTRGQRICRSFCNGNVKQFLSESETEVPHFKYLGHILSEKGSDDQDIGRQQKKIYDTDTDNTSGYTEYTEVTEDEEQEELPLSLTELLGVNVIVKSDNVNVMKNIITQVAKEGEGIPETDKLPEEVTLPLRDALNLVILISTIEDQMNNQDSMDESSLASRTESQWSVLTKDNPRDSLPLLKDMFLNGRPRLHQLRE